MMALPIRRAAGLGLAIGAILFVAHVVLRSFVTAGVDPAVFATRASWMPISGLGLAGSVLVLLSLPAMYARWATPSGLAGLVGIALIAVAWSFFAVFASLYGLLILPWLAEGAPALVSTSAPPPAGLIAALVSSLLAALVGSVSFGIAFVRSSVAPRWVGYVLPASALWMLLGHLLLAPSGPAQTVPVNLLSNLGAVVLSAALGYLGVEMWLDARRIAPRAPDILNHFALHRRGDGAPLPPRKK